MESYRSNNISIVLEKRGSSEFSKVSYPIRYGHFTEIKVPDYILEFNLNGEIKYIRGRHGDWPDPTEWLKRTEANDWVYYSNGGYSGVYGLMGEYYLPYPSYPSNSRAKVNPRPWESRQERKEKPGVTSY